jgi:MerR family mercuric resistance operon transcriptional regulator
MQERATMRIGRLAQLAGVHVETIRYYQRLGLLSAPPKLYGGQRRYGENELRRVQFIKQAQGLGFSLEEARLLLETARQAPCAKTQSIARQRLDAVERKLSDLSAIRLALVELIPACESNGSHNSACPIIERLETGSGC